MNERLTARCKHVQDGIYDRVTPGGLGDLVMLFMSIVEAAAHYWEQSDADDFCVQSFSGEAIVFGGTNRLIWTPAHGFRPDRSYCTPKFYEHALYLGPVPGPALAYEGIEKKT